MGKVLRVLVVLVAILGIAALVFAYKNYSKREALKGRADALEQAVVRIVGTFESEDLPKADAVSYPERDISQVTSRVIETPDRDDFWEGYKSNLEGPTEPQMLSFSAQSKRLQLRKLYKTDASGKVEIDPVTGKPATEGEGTMDELLKLAFDRAKAQYNNLIATRAQLKELRVELVDTVEELNRQKQSARLDKRDKENLENDVSRLTNEVRAEKARTEAVSASLDEERGKVEELNDKVASLEEEISQLQARTEEQEQIIRELKGASGGLKVVPVSDAAPQEGALTPGDKGRIVSASEEWKYAIVEFTPEFVDELIGQGRDRPLPACEVMVRRQGIENADEAFVGRLKLRQILRDKNLVIADILTEWQQKPLNVGDVVFY